MDVSQAYLLWQSSDVIIILSVRECMSKYSTKPTAFFEQNKLPFKVESCKLISKKVSREAGLILHGS